MIPEPTTVANRNAVPRNSAASLRGKENCSINGLARRGCAASLVQLNA